MRSNAWRTRFLGLGLALTCGITAYLPPPAAAQTTVPADVTKENPFPELEKKDGKIELSLDRAVEIGLQRNLGISIQRYNRTETRLDIVSQESLYDLFLNGNLDATDTQSPGTSRLAGSKSDSQSLGFSFGQNLPTGGSVSFGYAASRNGTNSSDQSAPTVFGTGTTFTFTQPLLDKFGRLTTEAPIILAFNTSRLAGRDFELQLSLLVQDVINAYWTLVGTREQLIVAEQSMALAKELHERNRIQVDVGTIPPLELVQSEAAIATREEDIIRAQAGIGDAEDALRRLLNFPSGELWETTIEPTTGPETEAPKINVNEAIATALAERPEIQSSEINLDNLKLNAEVARLALRPTLDLRIQNKLNGGDPQFGEAFNQVTGAKFPGWTAGLTFSMPLQNRLARAKRLSASLELVEGNVILEQQKLAVATEVRQAVRAVETAAKQIDAARKAREFQEKNLDAQRKRYENGMSTSFEITRVQDDLTQARSSEVSATISYRTALADYYRKIGRLLETHNVKIEDPDDTIQRFGFLRNPLPGE